MQSIQDKIKQYLAYLSPNKTAYATFTTKNGQSITNTYPMEVWEKVKDVYIRLDSFCGVTYTK